VPDYFVNVSLLAGVLLLLINDS